MTLLNCSRVIVANIIGHFLQFIRLLRHLMVQFLGFKNMMLESSLPKVNLSLLILVFLMTLTSEFRTGIASSNTTNTTNTTDMMTDTQYLNSTFHLDRKKAIEKIMNSHDSQVPPDFERDIPTLITVQVYIVSFDSISESTMDYSLSIFLRQTWTDPRLKYEKLDGVEMLELDPKIMDHVWVPDLYFINEKKASFHDVTVPNKLMHVFPSGEVLYSARVSMTLSCDMNLQKFPFDTQICHVSMESYSYSIKNIVFQWHPTPVIRREHLKLPQFEFKDNVNVDCTKTYVGTGINKSESYGKYTCLRTEFHLARTYGYYLAQVYVPSILIVILSWVSFWLDVDAVPARISLGLLTVLTMTTQSANARAHLPRVSYIKAIDVWMAMCLFFVFAALIEFAYVNVNARVEKRRSASQALQAQGGLRLNVGVGKNGNTPTAPDNDEESKSKRLFSKTTIGRAKARRLDKIARIVFPLIFVAFNIFYWIFYMTWEQDSEFNN